MRYRFVLLDVGGTMVGPRESFGAVYGRVFRALGVNAGDDDFESALRGVWAGMADRIPPGTDRYSHYEGGENEYWQRFSREAVERATGKVIGESLARTALERLREEFGKPEAWQVFPDVVPALEALRADGVGLGVVSNWDSRLPHVLEVLQLAPYFGALAVSHLERVEKPDPALFHRALGRLGGRAEETLHVGDTPELDIEGARAAGIDALLIDRVGRFDAAAGAHADFSALPAIARSGTAG